MEGSEIDFVDDFASEQIDFLRRELPKETRIAPYLGTYYYPINSKRPPFDNPKVRRALWNRRTLSSAGLFTLYADDATTTLATATVTDKDGAAITLQTGEAARSTALV